MRTNKPMRAATALMALTMITSCFVGGTFAKYLTTTSGNDSARVAYWGFNVTEKTDLDLFDATYDEGNVARSSNDTSTEVVNLIAPGTSKKTTFKFVNANAQAPEVAYTLEINADGVITDELEAQLEFYLDDENKTNPLTMAGLVDAIEALAGEGATEGKLDYVAGAIPAAFASDSEHTIEWEWTIGGVDDNGQGDDNHLGNEAFTADLDQLSLAITVTAEQID